MSPRARYGLVAASIFVVEVVVATRLAHLPFVRGSLGDVLVTALLYYFVLAIRDVARRELAVGVFAFACAVEVTQYLRLARQLGLQPGGVLWIVLGSSFTWSDIVCYFVGCTLALASDYGLGWARG